MSEAKWYVVHTYSGYENKVKANIEKTIENSCQIVLFSEWIYMRQDWVKRWRAILRN